MGNEPKRKRKIRTFLIRLRIYKLFTDLPQVQSKIHYGKITKNRFQVKELRSVSKFCGKRKKVLGLYQRCPLEIYISQPSGGNNFFGQPVLLKKCFSDGFVSTMLQLHTAILTRSLIK